MAPVELESLGAHLAGTDNEKKLESLLLLQNQLQGSCQITNSDQLTSLLRLALKTSNAQISNAALACLPHYFPLLAPHALSEIEQLPLDADSETPRPLSPSFSNTSHTSNVNSYSLKNAFLNILPVEKLGDSKERVRELAREGLVSAGRTALKVGINFGTAGKDKEGPWGYLCRIIQESGFGSKSPKAREQTLLYLLALRQPNPSHPPPPLRPFTPFLLPLLADADPTVRSLALSTTISIFSAPEVSAPARADLKKEIIKKDVSKKIQDTILAAVLGGGSTTEDGGEGIAGETPTEPITRPRPLARSTPSVISSTSALPAAAFSSDPVPGPADISPIYIASEKDLTDEFEAMRAGFEGKETEFNWMVRDKSVGRIRGMVRGGVTGGNFAELFLGCFKGVLEGVLKTASSLRTTVATSALSLISELSVAMGPALDPLLEPLLSHCLSMAGQTKKLVATASQSAATSLITNSAYHLKTIQLLWTGMNDKIVLARTFISAHLITFIKIHGAKKSFALVDSSGGVDLLELCIKKGLVDPNPIVKENIRAAYWASSEIWPKMTERILGGLDVSTRKALDKAALGKNVVAAGTGVTTGGGGKVTRPSMRELMAAKAAAVAASSTQDIDTPIASSSTLPTESTATPKRTAFRPNPPNGSSRPPPTSSPRSSARAASPRSPRQSARTPPPKSNNVKDDSNDLMSSTSPFRLDEQDDSAFDFDALPPPIAPTTTSNRIRQLSIPVEPIVEAALRDQADQAEQAAERLLEVLDDQEPPASVVEDRKSNVQTGTPVGKAGLMRGREDIFADSPEVRNGSGGGGLAGRKNWWMKKSSQEPIPTTTASDSIEQNRQIESLLPLLKSSSIDVIGLQQLSAISKARALRQEDENSDDESPLPSTGDSEVGVQSTREFWAGGKRFGELFAGLRGLLLKESQIATTREAALILLKDLVQNQFPYFSSEEGTVFSLLFQLREDPTRTTIGAVEGIADDFCAELEPLYGLGSLHNSLDQYLALNANSNGAEGVSYALGLRLFGRLFSRLPAEVLEEELAKLRDLIINAMNSPSGDLRRAAVTALVAAQTVLKDEQKIYAVVDGLGKDQMNLLAYYFSKG